MPKRKRTKTHKGQHWVPAAAYLEAWTDPDVPTSPVPHEPFVHVFSRDGQKHRRKAPVNIFKETDLYTIPKADGERDLRLEHGLNRLETAFSSIRRDFLEHERPLPAEDHVRLMAFVAAMHARTPMLRDQIAKHFGEVQSLMEEVRENMSPTTPNQRRRAAAVSAPAHDPRRTMTLSDVRQITANPMLHTLVPHLHVEARLLVRLRCLVLYTDSDPGFITSDNPVVWSDPEAYKRPPLYRFPDFLSPKFQITFPLSPRQLLLLVHGDARPIEYHHVDEVVAREANRITRFHCAEEFVVRRKFVDEHWLDPGKPPADAWENTHGKATPDAA
jgi:Protein of unknown function (DUF4238)